MDIETLMAAMSRVRESHATFREEKTIAALAEPLVSRGTLVYVAPSRLEKHTTAPFVEDIVVEGERLSFSRPATHEGGALSLDQVPELRGLVEAIRGVFAGDLATLQRYYSVDLEGSMDRWWLTLVPLGDRIKAFLKSIRFEGMGTDVRSVVTTEADGDVSRMSVEQLPR